MYKLKESTLHLKSGENNTIYTIFQNKRMRRCGVPPPPPPPIIFEKLKLPQQIIYRRKENLWDQCMHACRFMEFWPPLLEQKIKLVWNIFWPCSVKSGESSKFVFVSCFKWHFGILVFSGQHRFPFAYISKINSWQRSRKPWRLLSLFFYWDPCTTMLLLHLVLKYLSFDFKLSTEFDTILSRSIASSSCARKLRNLTWIWCRDKNLR